MAGEVRILGLLQELLEAGGGAGEHVAAVSVFGTLLLLLLLLLLRGRGWVRHVDLSVKV